MTPARIQLSRKKGWRMPQGAVKVDRTTKWGNPYKPGVDGVADAAQAVCLFAAALERGDLPADGAGPVFTPQRIRAELAGRHLACWCKVGTPCHADLLLRIANAKAGA